MLSSFHGFELILAIFAVLMGGLAVIRWFYSFDPEILRKALHVGMGLVSFSLPSLFGSIWPVMLLAGLMMVLLLGIRFAEPLRRKLGGVIYGVGRDSWGEIYFALGVAGLFTLSHGEPLYYGISILILVLADTAASLIGCRHGFRRYKVFGECKSVEGSLAFLTAAFLIGVLGLSLFGSAGVTVSLVVALAVALPATMVEAVAGKGTDNVFVPLCSFVLLKVLVTLNPLELAVFLSVVLATVPTVFMFLYDRSHPDVAIEAGSSTAMRKAPRRLELSDSANQMIPAKRDEHEPGPVNHRKASSLRYGSGSSHTEVCRPKLIEVHPSHSTAQRVA